MLRGTAVTRPSQAPFDFDKFFNQMWGEQTEEQKRAIEQVEIAWQDEEQFGRQAPTSSWPNCGGRISALCRAENRASAEAGGIDPAADAARRAVPLNFRLDRGDP